MRAKIKTSLLSAKVPEAIVDALLDAHVALKQNFYEEKYRPSELEGGRFAEAAIRVVEHLALGAHVPLSNTLPKLDENFLIKFANRVPTTVHDSLRIYIPRTLLPIYGIRNRRDVGHIGGDVNPNHADAYFVMSSCDWVLAELIRLTFSCSLPEAQAIVDDLVERRIPIIQSFDGFPKILRTNLSIPDRVMAIAYAFGHQGFSTEQIQNWLKPAKSSSIMVALLRLDRDKAYLHKSGDQCIITKSGMQYVEKNIGFVLKENSS